MTTKKATIFVIALLLLIGAAVAFAIPLVQKSTMKTYPSFRKGEQIQKRDGSMQEKVNPEDQIEFSDPGDDDVAKEVEQMDDLINQTFPSEYSEEDLSEDEINIQVELE